MMNISITTDIRQELLMIWSEQLCLLSNPLQNSHLVILRKSLFIVVWALTIEEKGCYYISSTIWFNSTISQVLFNYNPTPCMAK